jgi:polyhydroxyalkanoate synthase
MNAVLSSGAAADAAAPLDVLLTDAALGPAHRFVPASTVRLAGAPARRPWVTARRIGALGAEAVRIAVGTSAYAPPNRDRRFADPAWTQNPLPRRLVRGYLAAGATGEQLLAELDLDWRDQQRVHFLFENWNSVKTFLAAATPA